LRDYLVALGQATDDFDVDVALEPDFYDPFNAGYAIPDFEDGRAATRASYERSWQA
jgi:hypothetical protein